MSLTKYRQPLIEWAIAGIMLLLPVTGFAAGENSDEDEPPIFTEAYLKDPENQEAGKKIWEGQCRHCHGSSAYPGKAPKLKPRRYKPEFVYSRVTFGFRKMPSWKDVFTREQRMLVVSYVLSDTFSP